MYEGNPVDLRMEKTISADGIFDEATRQCRVCKYDPEEDHICALCTVGLSHQIFRPQTGSSPF